MKPSMDDNFDQIVVFYPTFECRQCRAIVQDRKGHLEWHEGNELARNRIWHKIYEIPGAI